MNKNKEHFGEFGYNLHKREAMRKGQFPTPLHIAELMAELVIPKGESLEGKLVYEPCVGTGNLFWPMRDKGAILIGNDIDLPSLETCKQRIPEAILTNCDIWKCCNPRTTIKWTKKKMVELVEEQQQISLKEKLDRNDNKRLKLIPTELKELAEIIDKAKQIKPWKYGLYCSEHIFYEPEETIKRLEAKLTKDNREFMEKVKQFQQKAIKEKRDKENNGNPIYFDCHRCNKKVIDEEVGICKCQTKTKHLLCLDCQKQSWGTREDGRLDTRELDIDDLKEEIYKET